MCKLAFRGPDSVESWGWKKMSSMEGFQDKQNVDKLLIGCVF